MLNKKIKKLKKFIKKEFEIKNMDINPSDTLINVAERIVMRSENCNLEEAYKKWLMSEGLHLPGWVCFMIVDEFSNDHTKHTINSTIQNIME